MIDRSLKMIPPIYLFGVDVTMVIISLLSGTLFAIPIMRFSTFIMGKYEILQKDTDLLEELPGLPNRLAQAGRARNPRISISCRIERETGSSESDDSPPTPILAACFEGQTLAFPLRS